MALRIGELLVQERIITPKQLDEALKAQMIYGGRLGTNLVELGHLTLDELATALGTQRQVPVATSADFEAVAPSTLELINAETAAKFVAFPLFRDGPRRLKVAMLNPYSIEDVDQLGFITGMRVVPYIAPELQLYFHLERHYGISRDSRYIRLAPDPTQVAAAVVPPTAAPLAANPVQSSLFGSLNPGEYLSADDDVDPFDVPVAPASSGPQMAPGAVVAPPNPPRALTPAGGTPMGHLAAVQPAPAPSAAPAPLHAPALNPPAAATLPAHPAPAPTRPSAPVHPQMTAAAPRQAASGHAQSPVAPLQSSATPQPPDSFAMRPANTPSPAQLHPYPAQRVQQHPSGPPLPSMPGYVQPQAAPPPAPRPHPTVPPNAAPPPRPRPRRVIEFDTDDSGDVELASPWEFVTWQGADVGTSASESEKTDRLELADAWEFVQWRPNEPAAKTKPEAVAPMPAPDPAALVTPVRAAVTPNVEDASATTATGTPANGTRVGGSEPTAAPDVKTSAAGDPMAAIAAQQGDGEVDASAASTGHVVPAAIESASADMAADARVGNEAAAADAPGRAGSGNERA